MTQQPYGSWPSPITPEQVAQAGRRLSDLQVDPTAADTLYWLESRPEEGGRRVIMCQQPGQAAHSVLPKPYSASSAVYEYGGAPYCVYAGTLWFVNGKDQAIYQRSADGQITRLTAETPEAVNMRFADLQYFPVNQQLIAIAETAQKQGANEIEPKAELVAINAQGRVSVIAQGHDFYASPRVSPKGDHLVWLAWNHPNMPWHQTALWRAAILPNGGFGTPRKCYGDRQESLFGPFFDAEGELFIVSDADNWWNVYQKVAGELIQITYEEAEFGLPQWVFGQKTCVFTANQQLYALSTAQGQWQLGRVDIQTGRYQPLDLAASFLEQLVATEQGLAVIMADAHTPKRIVRLQNLDQAVQDISKLEIEVVRTSATVPADVKLSTPQAVEYVTGNGAMAHGLFYPPAHQHLTGLDNEAPPLLIQCHGGPTAAASTAYNAKIQFWTSRGFAVLDVNYRGSTGYGRQYRNLLDKAWGVAEVEDCVFGVKFLQRKGLIDPKRVLISGSSAGGYTVLCVLTFTNLCAAGASYYGIGDLTGLFATTHKFESRYLEHLLGKDPAIYAERSPLNHAEQLACPVLFLQGLEDKVVPPAQAESMVEALKANQIPVQYVTFADEKHGFRRAENIIQAIRTEYEFYCQVLGIKPSVEALT